MAAAAVGVAVVALGLLGLQWFDPYAGRWTRYDRPALAFLTAIRTGDAAATARLMPSDSAAVAALRLAARWPARLPPVGRRLEAMRDSAAGDTLWISYWGPECPVRIGFLGGRIRPRVVGFDSSCPRDPPLIAP